MPAPLRIETDRAAAQRRSATGRGSTRDRRGTADPARTRTTAATRGAGSGSGRTASGGQRTTSADRRTTSRAKTGSGPKPGDTGARTGARQTSGASGARTEAGGGVGGWARSTGAALDRTWRRATGRPTTRRGGVAPFVEPTARLGRRQRMREWQRRGFVPLSPGRPKLRHRILPRSVIGIAFMLLSMGVGAAFSGAAFYAYYDDRLAENERAVARFVDGFDQQFSDASGALDEMRTEAIGEIRRELEPLGDYVADADGVIGLPGTAGPSVWLLESRDQDGEIVTGSAFAVLDHRDGTAMLTSYSLVVASTTTPSPGIDLLKGNERIPAQLWSWDEERDLALLLVDRDIPPLALAGERAQVASIGSRVFALSGVGGQGATASPGVLLDHSQVGLQHTVPVGTLFRGGPLLTGDGKVVGVASDDYRPFGIDAGDVRQAPDVRGICVVVLQCAEIEDEVDAAVVADEPEAPPRSDEPVRQIEPTDDATDPEEGDTGDPAPSEEGSTP